MNRIKAVLEDKGIKQTWLAEQLGKSYNMVNGYVQNRQQPRLEVLYEIASILNIFLSFVISFPGAYSDIAISKSLDIELKSPFL